MGDTNAPSAEDVARAKELARRLIRASQENGPEAERARAELESISHVVSDLVADELVREMDRDALRVCAVYSNHVRPYWFESGRAKMIAKLTELSEKDPVLMSFVMVLRTVQVRKDALEKAVLGRRILSSLGRPWVIAFVWFPAAFVGLAIATVDHTTFRLAATAGLVIAFVAVVVQGAYARRCPSCERTLAGMPVGLRHTGSYSESVHVETPSGPSTVSQTAHSYATLLRCVHCGRRWER
jgi:hypothetical protein